MPTPLTSIPRRTFLAGLGLAGVAFYTPGVMAEELTRTPKMTEGPFYPDKLPLDTDNDLIIVNDNLTPAIGEITHLTGRVLSTSGEPMPIETLHPLLPPPPPPKPRRDSHIPLRLHLTHL